MQKLTPDDVLKEPTYTHTVFDNTTHQRHDCPNLKAAVTLANRLARQEHKVAIRPHKPPRRYIDIVAERGPNG